MRYIIKRFSFLDDTYSLKSIKTGEEISLEKEQPWKITKFLGKFIKKIRDNVSNCPLFIVKNSKGEEIGQLELDKRSDKELNISWIWIKNKNQGYAQSILTWLIGVAKSMGFKKLTLEVPGISPNARHIYEKLGFKKTGKSMDDFVWDGLTEMKLKL